MKPLDSIKCSRHKPSDRGGVAVITVNDLELDCNFGADLCDELDRLKLNHVCRFDVSDLEQCLGDCLCSHRTALIIDSTENGTKSGTVSLLDLGLFKETSNQIRIPSSHGTIIASELKRINKEGHFPERVILLGVESPYSNKLKTETTPLPMNTVATILSTLLETLNRKSVVA